LLVLFPFWFALFDVLLLPLVVGLDGGTGCKTRSKNFKNGNNEATAAAVDGGELGNGRWMIAFAFGGGRTGNSRSPSPAPSPA
jgi:hypothetical protein